MGNRKRGGGEHRRPNGVCLWASERRACLGEGEVKKERGRREGGETSVEIESGWKRKEREVVEGQGRKWGKEDSPPYYSPPSPSVLRLVSTERSGQGRGSTEESPSLFLSGRSVRRRYKPAPATRTLSSSISFFFHSLPALLSYPLSVSVHVSMSSSGTQPLLLSLPVYQSDSLLISCPLALNTSLICSFSAIPQCLSRFVEECGPPALLSILPLTHSPHPPVYLFDTHVIL